MLTIILVCPADRLPTRYQQVANRSPTVGRLLADNTLASNITQTVGRQLGNSRPTVGRQSADCRPTVGQQLANSWPTVGQQSVDCRPTVDRQSANRFFGELFFTITHPSNCLHFSHLICGLELLIFRATVSCYPKKSWFVYIYNHCDSVCENMAPLPLHILQHLPVSKAMALYS